MFKTLLKKQMTEFFAAFFIDRKTGKSRSKNAALAYGALYIFLFVTLGGSFYTTAKALCAPLFSMNLGWLYFAIMSMIAVAIGVFGSAFNTYAVLYKAKDNDLLMAMPIPPRMILISRLTGTWIMGLVFECIVMIPATIQFFLFQYKTPLSIAFTILLIVEISVIIIVLSCFFGWIIAIISNKLKNKSIVTVAASLVFLAVYYFVYARAMQYIKDIVTNAQAISQAVKSYGYPLYQLGLAAMGKVLPMLFTTGINAAALIIVIVAMSKSFGKLTSAANTTYKIKYKEKETKRQSVFAALLRKEFNKYFSSPNYILNCGLGTFAMPVLGVLSLFKGKELVNQYFNLGDVTAMLPVLAAAVICVSVSMNDITAPSVSLEGKALWLIQSYPVNLKYVLNAKLLMHFILTAIPVCFAGGCFGIAFDLGIINAILICFVATAFTYLNGVLGLFLNLKKPNLTWTNEIVPIKQSMSVTITIFGSLGMVVAFGLLYFLIGKFIPVTVYLIIVFIAVTAVAAALHNWLNKKGTEILKNL